MNLFKRTRIARLFFSAFALVILIVTVVIARISYLVASRELANNTATHQRALLVELNKQLHLQLNSLDQISLSALRNIQIISYNARQKNAYERKQSHQDLEYSLASITYSTTVVTSIYVYMEPPVPASQLNAAHFFDAAQMETQSWYPLIQDSESAWLPEHVIQTNLGEQNVISFARRVHDAWPYNGVILFNVKVSEIQKLIGNSGERNRMLFDAAGNIITSMGNPQEEIDSLAALMKDVTEESGSTLTADRKYLVVWDTTPSGWRLLEATPWDSIMSVSRRLALLLMSVGLLAVIAASGIVLFISHQLTKPLRLLAHLMSRYPAESDILSLPKDYTNEFGYLFSGYGGLIERNKELMESLKVQYQLQNEAEIKALQAMINPHFLYNTLDQINWMAIDAGQEDISTALSLMGKMFRIGLSHGEPMISIEQEIAHVEYYLQLQKLRWQDRLTYMIELEPELAFCMMPRLTLQPFVENSILHGFHRRDRGEIHISIRGEHDDIVITIRDNGVGISPDWRTRKKRAGGYGLQNVLKRIEVLYQPPYGVQIDGVPNEGTTVTIRLERIEATDYNS